MMPFLVLLDNSSVQQETDPEFNNSWRFKLPSTASGYKPSTQATSRRQPIIYTPRNLDNHFGSFSVSSKRDRYDSLMQSKLEGIPRARTKGSMFTATQQQSVLKPKRKLQTQQQGRAPPTQPINTNWEHFQIPKFNSVRPQNQISLAHQFLTDQRLSLPATKEEVNQLFEQCMQSVNETKTTKMPLIPKQKPIGSSMVMRGSQDFKQPPPRVIQMNIIKAIQQQSENFIAQITRNESHLKGLMHLAGSESRSNVRREQDPISQYVQKINQVRKGGATFLNFTRQIARSDSLEVINVENNDTEDEAFYETFFQNKQAQEKLRLQKLATALEDKAVRIKLIKKQRKETDIVPQRAHLEFYNQCSRDLVLPVLEKVIGKTLCLLNYTVSEGVCRALAQAIPMSVGFNKVVFSNNGISDASFGAILEGLCRVKDIRSIVYKQNQFGAVACSKLGQIAERMEPYHLDELGLMDIDVKSQVLFSLIDVIQKSNLSSLTLVNINIQRQHIPRLAALIPKLQQLNLSWLDIPSKDLLIMLQSLKQSKLTHLTLQHNQISQVTEIQELISSSEHIVLVDLSHCDLNQQQCQQLIDSLGPSIQSLILTGNPGTQSVAHTFRQQPPQIVIKPVTAFEDQLQAIQSIKESRIGVQVQEGCKFILNRKIPAVGSEWVLHQSGECYIQHRYCLTAFIWNETVGQQCDTHDTKYQEYSQKRQVPCILGQFTQWQPVVMRDLLTFLIENDPSPPNTIQELFDEQKILSRDNLSVNESKIVLKRQQDYYSKHMISKVKSICGVRNLQLALPTINTEHSLYIYLDYIKPGRHDYLIQSSKLYSHTLNSLHRQESPPTLLQKPPPQDNKKPTLFRPFQDDSSELNQLCLKHDLLSVTCYGMLEERDRRLIDLIIKENYTVIKEVYQHCLARSPEYPVLSLRTLFDQVISLLCDWKVIQEFQLEQETKRYMLIEILVRLAYQTRQQQHTSVVLRSLLGVMRDFWQQNCKSRQQERQKVFWTQQVESVFVNNDFAIRKLYKKLSHEQFVTLKDIQQIKVGLSERELTWCYASSKQTSVTDSDYNKLLFIEFYEFLCRVAEVLYKESEDKHKKCHDKLRTLLKIVLPQVGCLLIE